MEKCDICGKEFETSNQLKGHMISHKRTLEGKAEETKERKKRIPLGVPRLKLDAKASPGRKGRWLNDVGDRINAGLDGGYEFEKDSEGRKKSKVVGKTDDGAEIKAYFMSIDEELYKEDQAAKQADIDKVEAQIYKGKHDEKQGDNRYVPKEGINVHVSNIP